MKTAWTARAEHQIARRRADRADIVLEASVHMVEQVNDVGRSHIREVIVLLLIPRYQTYMD